MSQIDNARSHTVAVVISPKHCICFHFPKHCICFHFSCVFVFFDRNEILWPMDFVVMLLFYEKLRILRQRFFNCMVLMNVEMLPFCCHLTFILALGSMHLQEGSLNL